MSEPAQERRECVVCVMDTTDPAISFDVHGQCNHCRGVRERLGVSWFPNDEGERMLHERVDQIKRDGARADYDCIIGLSGGIDSSFLLLKAMDWGLRPLVVHIDAGWNTELAVQNIEKLVKYTGFDLHTHVINWATMRELQLSYLRAGVANQDTPQDHAFFAGLYRFAKENGIRSVLNGGNVATEGVFPSEWQWSAMDLRSLKAIHSRFGTGKLDGYPTVTLLEFYFWLPRVRRIRPWRPLNFMPYDKDGAIAFLTERVDWRPYPRKHGESLFTRFYQDQYLPVRFGYDMRRPHLSSLIAAGSMTKDEATKVLDEPLYEPRELVRDQEYMCRKLGIDESEFRELMAAPLRHPRDLPNWDDRYQQLKRVQQRVSAMTGRSHSIYS